MSDRDFKWPMKKNRNFDVENCLFNAWRDGRETRKKSEKKRTEPS